MEKTNFNTLLSNGLGELQLPFTEKMLENVNTFFRLYQEWNKKKASLSSILDDKDFITRHLLDSLTPISYLKENLSLISSKQCVDLGSGGGFPGVPMKIFQPDIKLDFAEVNKKKICFLKEVILNLPLPGVNVIDTSTGKVKENYQLLFTRAFGSLQKICQEARIYIKKGFVVAYKGKKDKIDEEIKQLSSHLRKRTNVHKVQTPFLNEERHIVIIDL